MFFWSCFWLNSFEIWMSSLSLRHRPGTGNTFSTLCLASEVPLIIPNKRPSLSSPMSSASLFLSERHRSSGPPGGRLIFNCHVYSSENQICVLSWEECNLLSWKMPRCPVDEGLGNRYSPTLAVGLSIDSAILGGTLEISMTSNCVFWQSLPVFSSWAYGAIIFHNVLQRTLTPGEESWWMVPTKGSRGHTSLGKTWSAGHFLRCAQPTCTFQALGSCRESV